ncbi:hypothetical protein S245_065635, partial [Arachis hypogaea]
DIHGVESMIVDMNEITIDPRIIIIALRRMPKLRLLALRGNINLDLEWNIVFVKDFQLSNDLRYIEWNKCPLKFLPSICWPQKLVQLSMRGSNIKKLWDTKQMLPSLEMIDLGRCKDLIECPNLTGATNLKKISFYGCENLQDVHPSIFSLSKIEDIYLDYCKKLKRLYSDYCSPSLSYLWTIGCSNLEEFSIPMIGDHSKSLYLSSSALSEESSTIMHLKNLTTFGINISYSIEKLPQNFARTIALMDPIKHEDDTCIILSRILPTPVFLSLKRLSFEHCKSLSKLPDNIHVLQSLQELSLESCHAITSLPESIKNLQKLIQLFIDDCKMLQYVPPLPPSIIYFAARNCKSLKTISSLTSEPPKTHWASFKFYNCTKLDDDAYEAVLKDLKSRIELAASNECSNISFYYLPSKESILNDWFPHYYSTETSITVEVPPDHKISSCLVVCMLFSQFQSRDFSNKHLTFRCECYLEKGCNEWEWIATSGKTVHLTDHTFSVNQFEMISDHMILWYDGEYSNKIMEAIKERKRGTTCNPILKFEFYAHQPEDNEEVVIKGCGIRWMHVNDEEEINPDVIDEGEIIPDVIIDEGHEYDHLELEDLQRTGKRVDVHCCALDIVNWFKRLLWWRTETKEEI